MTKKEVEKEYWFKGKISEEDEDDFQPYKVIFGDEHFSDYIWIPDSVEIVEAIPEREKVTIPKEVAEWIEEHKGQFSTVYTAFRILVNREYGIKKWVNENQDNFARAWLDGYTVEEPMGVLLVDMPANSTQRYYFVRMNSTLETSSIDSCDFVHTLLRCSHKVTEAEAKEKYPNFKWVSLEELENE